MLIKPIKIHISSLGPIRDAELEITDLMIFSGESGLGKSYLAILSHYFFEVMLDGSRLEKFLREQGVEWTVVRESLGPDAGEVVTINRDDLEKWMARDAVDYMRYMLGNENMTADISVSFPDTFPESFTVTYEQTESAIIDDTGDRNVILQTGEIRYRAHGAEIFGEENPISRLLELYLGDILTGDPLGLRGTYEMPPSRGAFMTEKVVPQTGLYIEFQKFLDFVNRSKINRLEPDTALLEMMGGLIEGQVKYEDSKYLYLASDNSMPVSAAAASVRELGAIDLLVRNIRLSTSALLIEEPEAHLHPSKQRLMADLVAKMSNIGAAIQITTHSDYFLRRINEMILLHRIGLLMPEEAFAGFCRDNGLKANLALDPSRISAYLLKRGEGCSLVERQSLEDGVPFSAFLDAINRSLELEDLLADKLTELSDEKH